MIITFGYIKKKLEKKKKKKPCIEVAVPRPAAVKSAD
jgi:hypothetical protein